MTEHTPGPWEYVPSNEHHGAYVSAPFGGDICDCYTMSDLSWPSTAAGGTSRPVPFFGEQSEANARLIAAAPELLAACRAMVAWNDAEESGPDYGTQTRDTHPDGERIWREWWDGQLRLCGRAFATASAAIAKAEGEDQ